MGTTRAQPAGMAHDCAQLATSYSLPGTAMDLPGAVRMSTEPTYALRARCWGQARQSSSRESHNASILRCGPVTGPTRGAASITRRGFGCRTPLLTAHHEPLRLWRVDTSALHRAFPGPWRGDSASRAIAPVVGGLVGAAQGPSPAHGAVPLHHGPSRLWRVDTSSLQSGPAVARDTVHKESTLNQTPGQALGQNSARLITRSNARSNTIQVKRHLRHQVGFIKHQINHDGLDLMCPWRNVNFALHQRGHRQYRHTRYCRRPAFEFRRVRWMARPRPGRVGPISLACVSPNGNRIHSLDALES